MRKWILALSLLFILVLISGCGNDRSFTIDQVDIRAQVMEDGDLYVEELYTYNFSGEFNGTTRSLGSKGHDGVEFFEAYLPPADPELGSFSYEDSVRLRTELNDNTYRIHTKSKDETKQVYYRYRVDHAANKYLDTGELYWAFFDSDNETDLHHLSIEIMLPHSVDASKVDYYLHDRTGGRISKVSGRSIHYYTELMPSLETTEFRLLFPAEWLPDSPLTANENRKDSIRAKEQKLETRFNQRRENLAQAKQFTHRISILILLAIIYFSFLTPYKLAGLNGRRVAWDELETLDPLFVAFIRRRGRLTQKDITAGLFSLYQKGWLTISKIPASARFQRDPKAPNETFRFTFTGERQPLNEYEQYFVDWLFKNIRGNKYRTFTLESISGPPREDRSNSKVVDAYRKRMERFKARFETWKQRIMQHEHFTPYYTDNRAVRWVVPTLTFFLYAMTLYLYHANASSWSAIGWTAVLLGAFAVIAVWYWRSKGTFVGYCIFCFLTITQITFSEATFAFAGTIVLSIILRLVMPSRVPTLKGAPYRVAIARWRKALKRKSYPTGNELARLERLMQYAIVLDVSKPFAKYHATLVNYEELKDAFPLVSIPHETSDFFRYTYHTWSASGSSGTSGTSNSSGGGGSFGGGGGSGGGGGAGAF